jgi:hypothetical protein
MILRCEPVDTALLKPGLGRATTAVGAWSNIPPHTTQEELSESRLGAARDALSVAFLTLFEQLGFLSGLIIGFN